MVALEGAETVRVDVAVPLAETVRLVGFRVTGRLPAMKDVDSATVPANPWRLTRVMKEWADAPWSSVRYEGLAVRRKPSWLLRPELFITVLRAVTPVIVPRAAVSTMSSGFIGTILFGNKIEPYPHDEPYTLVGRQRVYGSRNPSPSQQGQYGERAH